MFTIPDSQASGRGEYVQATVGGSKLAKEIVQAVEAGRWTQADTLAAGTRDPLIIKLHAWLSYTKKRSGLEFGEVSRFVDDNPDWPKSEATLLLAEDLMPETLSPDDALAWFARHDPSSFRAITLYLDALKDSGNKDVLAQEARRFWKTMLISTDKQRLYLDKYGRYLDHDSHLARFDYLLYQRHYTNARTVADILGKGYPLLADARIALAEDKNNVDRTIDKVPVHLQQDAGLAYERMKWRRRHDMDFRAMEILYSPPPSDQIVNLEDWWSERHVLARRLIAEKRYKSAYNLVSRHVQKEGVSYAEAEFLAGWLALEFLNQPWKAFEHFERLYYKTSTPISRSRGAYWAARASAALGDKKVSNQWYRVAAQHQVAFYGQMALAMLPDGERPPQQVPPEKTIEGQRAFENWDLVRMVRLMDEAGQNRMADRFLDAILSAIKTPEQYRLAAELATDIRHYHNAVKIARAALQKNILLIDQAYPTIVSRLQAIDLEWALVHGIIRQESGFDAEITSPAGARGLMQLMPATAKDVARRKGIRHYTSWLTSKPDHNIFLGSAYMEQMLDTFDGSYPLAAAAYNAGPGRVRQWLGEYGDPRKGEIDMVNWIEMIPFSETRNYVQRVLESTYIYRIKLKNVQDKPGALLHVAYNQP